MATVMGLAACSGDWRSVFSDPDPQMFTANFWQTPLRGADYPEMQDPMISSRASFGVAFQGGGNRAAPATLGQLRALHEMGWIDHVRYVSAISGGSWTSLPYTYLKTGGSDQESRRIEELFLGRTYGPQDVARILPALDRAPEDGIARRIFAEGSMHRAISEATVSAKMVRAWLSGRFDEAYSNVLEGIYFTPFGLGRKGPNGPDSLFTWRAEDEVRLRNRVNRLQDVNVHRVERNRPYLIVGGALLTRRTNITEDSKFRTEMTPLYSGMPVAVRASKAPGQSVAAPVRRIGGGFVESYGYDYPTLRVQKGGSELVLTDPQFGNRTDPFRLNFSLANAAAVSGAAPVEAIVTATPTAVVLANFGFPEHYVPNTQPNIPVSEALARRGELFQREWAHGDGGHEDNLGLAPLLARQVENIIVFANAFAPLDKGAIDDCKLALAQMARATQPQTMPDCATQMIGSDIPSFFFETPAGGVFSPVGKAHNVSLTLQRAGGHRPGTTLRQLQDVVRVAQDLRDDHVSCQSYRYNPSDFAIGVPYSPTICFVYLNLERNWINAVMTAATDADKPVIMEALDVKADGRPADPDPAKTGFGSSGFPHLGTFFDKGARIIKVTRPRIFALSNLTSWALKDKRAVIAASFRQNGLHLP